MRPTRNPKLAPYLVVEDAPGLIGFIEDGLGGKLTSIEKGEGGRIHHAEVRIADSVVMLAEVPPGQSRFPAMLHLYVPDADSAYKKAVKAGAVAVRPPAVANDGYRRGGVRDAHGNQWWFSSPVKERSRNSKRQT